jgi:hypothetical protein
VNGEPESNGSIGDAASLIAAVATLVAGSTQTIMSRLDENARGATERWRLHDEQLADNTRRVVARFEALERGLTTTEQALRQHLDAQHDEDLVMQARVRPVRIGVAWMVAHWKDVAILVVAVLGLFAVTADILSRYLGGTP